MQMAHTYADHMHTDHACRPHRGMKHKGMQTACMQNTQTYADLWAIIHQLWTRSLGLKAAWLHQNVPGDSGVGFRGVAEGGEGAVILRTELGDKTLLEPPLNHLAGATRMLSPAPASLLQGLAQPHRLVYRIPHCTVEPSRELCFAGGNAGAAP